MKEQGHVYTLSMAVCHQAEQTADQMSSYAKGPTAQVQEESTPHGSQSDPSELAQTTKQKQESHM